MILLEFYYQACYPCMMAIPGLANIYNHYKNSGVMIIGINPMDTSIDKINKMLSLRGATYPLCLRAAGLIGPYGGVGGDYPTLFVLDEQKRVIKKFVGYNDRRESELKTIIETQLNIGKSGLFPSDGVK